jgi:hypothetical protein
MKSQEIVNVINAHKKRHNRLWNVDIKPSHIEIVNNPAGTCSFFDEDIALFASLRSIGCRLRIDLMNPRMVILIIPK